MNGNDKDLGTDELISIEVDQGVVKLKSISLGSGTQAQTALISTPKPDNFILAGIIQERWALISKYIAPAVPCELHPKKKCLLVNNPDLYSVDTVNWMGCDWPCNRWFHF